MDHASASLWDLSAAQLRDRIASTDPSVGGGSASIIAATLGIASVQKGIAVSLKRSATEFTRHKSLLNLNSRASVLLVSLSELADADSQAFQSYLEACALPRGMEAEKAVRRAAKEKGLLRATQIPLAAAAKMLRGLEIAEAATVLLDAHVRSEVIGGAALLRASVKSVLLSVDANLKGISDETLRSALRLERDEMERGLERR